MQEKMKTKQDIKVIANMRKNNRAITLIALVITIVLNCSYLAMDRMNKIEKI